MQLNLDGCLLTTKSTFKNFSNELVTLR